jgi:hypothetical protein
MNWLAVGKFFLPYILALGLLAGVYAWADHHFSAEQKAIDAKQLAVVVADRDKGINQLNLDAATFTNIKKALDSNKAALAQANAQAATATAAANKVHAETAATLAAWKIKYGALLKDSAYARLLSKTCEEPSSVY